MVVFNNIIAGASGATSGAAAGFKIDRSLRFNSADSAYLNRTPSSAGNRKTWTWSGWVKRSGLGAYDFLFNAETSSVLKSSLSFWNGDYIRFKGDYNDGTARNFSVSTNALFRDPSAWYHVVCRLDTTQATAADRIKIWVNGVEQTFSSATYPTQNSDIELNNNSAHLLGSQTGAPQNGLDGYLAEVHFVDGQALAPTDFGEYDDNNVWQPIEYAGSYGTNGFRLDFSDNSSAAALGTDSSGNSNTWTVNNLSVASGAGNDSLIDTPTDYTADSGNPGGNYCTMNPLDNGQGTQPTFSNGNLETENTGSNVTWTSCRGTIGMKTGKYYFEWTNRYAGGGLYGIADAAASTNPVGTGTGGWTWGGANRYFNGSSGGTGLSNHAVGDVIQIAFDADTGKLWFGRNGTFYDSSWGTTGDPGAGTNNTTSVTAGVDYFPALANLGSSGQSNADPSAFNAGQRPFAYTPPTGYLSLCTQNLTDPTIADGSTAMDVALYTGNDGTQSITGLGFSPDFVWVKNRSTNRNHYVYDAIRGAGTAGDLAPNTTDAEDNLNTGLYGYLSAFTSDGFTVVSGTDSTDNFNSSGQSYVGWTWDAGTGSPVSNTDGSITSSVRANASAGFSIVSYTGNNTAGATVGHGLNAKPGTIWIKNRSSSGDWAVYHQSLGATERLILNSTAAAVPQSVFMNDTEPTTSVFSLGTSGNANALNDDFVAYCFAPVEGYSAFGSYTGNGSADGPFVYTGFRPRYLLTKASSATGPWIVRDTERDEFNSTTSAKLAPNYSYEENNSSFIGLASQTLADFLSNGFKVRSTGGISNDSGVTYIYAAFAEHPFKTARAR